jgi:AraC-like DNA-binding protein
MQYLSSEPYKDQTKVSHIVPPALKALRIPFAYPTYTESPFGNFLTQQCKWNGLAIEQTHFFIREAVLLQPFMNRSGLYLHFTLQGNLLGELTGWGQGWLKEGWYNLFYVPAGEHKIWFTPGTYLFFSIRLSISYLRQLADKYASVKELTNQARQGAKQGRKNQAAPITPLARKLIREIIECPEEAMEREIYVQARIKDMVVLYAKGLATASRKKKGVYKNGNRVKAIVQYINEHIEDKMTIASLSKEFGISDFTLKKIFKTYLEITVHQYIEHWRMQTALAMLITTTQAIGDIAAQVSYPDPSHFDRVFRKYFHASPETIRKKWR